MVSSEYLAANSLYSPGKQSPVMRSISCQSTTGGIVAGGPRTASRSAISATEQPLSMGSQQDRLNRAALDHRFRQCQRKSILEQRQDSFLHFLLAEQWSAAGLIDQTVFGEFD